MNSDSRQPKPRSLGVIEPQTLRLDLPPEGFVLELGGVLKQIDVTYEICGEMNADGSNIIYICHALTGDAHVAGIRPGEERPDGWWEGMVGPGKGIDTDYYCVICSNMLAGCKGTTGPSSTNPDTGEPYGSTFPSVTVRDMVDVQYRLLRQLGIKRLVAVIGGSFGGMQVLVAGVTAVVAGVTYDHAGRTVAYTVAALLMGLIGSVLGPEAAVLTYFLAPFFGLIYGVWNLALHKDHELPYGPFLSMAAVIVMLTQSRLMNHFWPGLQSIWLSLSGGGL